MLTKQEADELLKHASQLKDLDNTIRTRVQQIAQRFRQFRVGRTGAQIAEGAELSWSCTLRGYWRFIVRYEDEVVDLMQCEPAIRVEVFTSGAMSRLVRRAFGIPTVRSEP